MKKYLLRTTLTIVVMFMAKFAGAQTFQAYMNLANSNISLMQSQARIHTMQEVFDRGHRLNSSLNNSTQKNSVKHPLTSAILVVGHDQAVSKQVRSAYISDLEKNSGKKTAMSTDNLFGDIQGTFSRAVSPYGLKNDNFADVMTAYLIVMWMSVNHQTVLPKPVQVQAVRSQMGDVFTNEAARVSDAKQRQTVAEFIMYQTCTAIVIREQGQSNPDILNKLADATNQNMLKQGISLRTLALTDRGLVKR